MIIPDGSKHPVTWTIEYLKSRGVRITDAAINQILPSWAAYINSVTAAQNFAETEIAEISPHDDLEHDAEQPSDNDDGPSFTFG